MSTSDQHPSCAPPNRPPDFELLVMPHVPAMHSFLRRQINNEDDVADLCQEVLLRACRNLTDFAGRSSHQTWLFSIARHAVADHYRRLKMSPFVADQPTEAPVADRDAVHRLCDARAQIKCCLWCVTRHLTIEQQVAVLLCEFLGVRAWEAARALRKSLSAYKDILHRARAGLQRACGQQCVLVAKTGIAAVCPRPQPPFGKRTIRADAGPRRLLRLRSQLLHQILFFDPGRATHFDSLAKKSRRLVSVNKSAA